MERLDEPWAMENKYALAITGILINFNKIIIILF